MGDVVLQTATINWLKALYGHDLRISFLTSKEFSSLLESHPQVQQVLSFDRRGGEKMKDLVAKISSLHREHKIDLMIDLHATLRSWHLRQRLFMLPQLVVDKRRWERFFLTKIPVPFIKNIFRKKFFGLEPQVIRILKDFESVFWDSRALRRTQDFRKGSHGELTSLGTLEVYRLPENYLVLAPSASFVDKRWSIENFVELARKLLESTTQTIVVLAGPTDSFCEAFNEIKSERLLNLQGKTSLKESMSILSRAQVCIGNDSGMNHIAEAYEVPCITIFGPTDPLFGFAPHGKKSQTLSKDLWCKPCSTTGSKPCFRDRRYCMEMISVGDVMESYEKVIAR
jgi:heptosyltransferase II